MPSIANPWRATSLPLALCAGLALAGVACSSAATEAPSAPSATPTTAPASVPAPVPQAPEDPAEVLDRSLGEFDGEIARERDAMARAGKGSGQAADGREARDASAVKGGTTRDTGGSRPTVQVSGPGLPGMGGMGGIGMPGGVGGEPGTGPQGQGGKQSGKQGGKSATGNEGGVGPEGEAGAPADTGEGQPGGKNQKEGKSKDGEADGEADGEGGEADADGGSGPGGVAGDDERRNSNIPADIPVDRTGEDQVARQIREAAEDETDPAVRDALWNEYRRLMGIKTK
jgi:hypothetical protein